MKTIACLISYYLIKNHYIDASQRKVYQYSIQILFEVCICFMTSVIIMIILGMIGEGVLFLLFFVPLRSFLGGLHLKRFASCYIVSTATFYGVLAVTQIYTPDIVVSLCMVAGSMLTCIIITHHQCHYVTCKQSMQCVRCLLSIYILIVIILFLHNERRSLFLIACTLALLAASMAIERIIKPNIKSDSS